MKKNIILIAVILISLCFSAGHGHAAHEILAVEEIFPVEQIEKGIKKDRTVEVSMELSRPDHPACLVDDSIPAGASEELPFIFSVERPFSGRRCMELTGPGRAVSYFVNPGGGYRVEPGDNIVFYLMVPGEGPAPRQILAGFYDEEGSAEHRVFLGEDLMDFGGESGTFSNFRLGPVPARAGVWHRVVVPASRVGLSGRKVCGLVIAKDGPGVVRFDRFTRSVAMNDRQQAGAEPVERFLDAYKGSFVNLSLSAPGGAPGAGATVAVLAADGRRYEKKIPAGADGSWLYDLTDLSGAVVPSGDATIEVRYGGSDGSEKTAAAVHRVVQLVAGITVPWNGSIVSATVPVMGDAAGLDFSRYTVTLDGLGADRRSEVIADVPEARFLTDHSPSFPGKATVGGNLCSIDFGSNLGYKYEKRSAKSQSRYNGRYRITLTVYDRHGNSRSDSRDIIAGRILSNTEAKFIESDDGARAAIFCEPYSITEGFTLGALMAAGGSLPAGSPVLSNGRLEPLSEIYEARPRGLSFDLPATVRIGGVRAPSGGASASAIFMYDGPEGWKRLPTRSDGEGGLEAGVARFARKGKTYFAAWGVQKGSLEAPEDAELGGVRKPPVAPQPLEVSSPTHPFLFQCDFENGISGLEPRSVSNNVELAVDDRERASGRRSLRITGRGGHSDCGVSVVRDGFDAARYPVLSFDYKCPATFEVNLMAKALGKYFEFGMSHRTTGSAISHISVPAPPFVRDGKWHSYRINLMEAIGNHSPEYRAGTTCEVEELFFCDYRYAGWAEVEDGRNAAGSSYWLDNVSLSSGGSSSRDAVFEWRPRAAGIASYRVSFDQVRDGEPFAATTECRASYPLAVNAGSDDMYLHISCFDASSKQVGSTMHFSVRADCTPPAVISTVPADGAVASSSMISARIDDGQGSGVDPSRLECDVEGTVYRLGDGALTFDSASGTMKLEPFKKSPPPPGFVNGQRVRARISGVRDNAGNAMARPFEFSFAVDYSSASSGDERVLTQTGGEWPCWTPDSRAIVYSAPVSGRYAIFRASVEDGRPTPVSADASSDYRWPCVLPHGGIVASKKDPGGRFAIVSMKPDGSGEKKLFEPGGDGDVMPSASPDGRSIAFVRSNEIWTAPAEGGAPVRIVGDVNGFFLEPSFSPDSGKIAYRKDLYTNTVWVCEKDGSGQRIATSDGFEFQPSFSHDGARLFYSRTDDSSSYICSSAADGSDVSRITKPGTALVRSPRVSPDGSMLAYESTSTGMWNISLLRLVKPPKLEVSGGAAAPAADGRAPVPAAKEEGVFVSFDVADEKAIVTAAVYDGSGKLVSKPADGRQVVRGTARIRLDGPAAGGKLPGKGPYVVKVELASSAGKRPALMVARLDTDASTLGAPADYGAVRKEVAERESSVRAAEDAAAASAKRAVEKGRDAEPPSAVGGLVASGGVSRITIRFSPPVAADLTGYSLKRTRVADGSSRTFELPSGISGYEDAAVEPGETYRYSIAARDSSGNESAAREAVATAEYDYAYHAIETASGVSVVRIDQAELEIAAVDASGKYKGVQLMPPPNMAPGASMHLSSSSGKVFVFCREPESGDVYYCVSPDLRSFSGWKLLYAGLEPPVDAGSASRIAFSAEQEAGRFGLLCYDPATEKLWTCDLSRAAGKASWKLVRGSLIVPDGISVSGTFGMTRRAGKTSLYIVSADGKDIRTTTSSDLKAWSAWKKVLPAGE